MRVGIVMAALGILAAHETVAAGPVDVLPLHVRRPGQKVLIVASHSHDVDSARETLQAVGVPFEITPSFDIRREDYSEFFAIVSGSNAFDYFGQSPERKEPAAFEHLEKFVRRGGHLFVYGTFNARHCEHLQRFGIRTGFVHCPGVSAVPGHTEALFSGSEKLVPEDMGAVSVGHLTVDDADVAYVEMLKRSGSNAKGLPALVTLQSGSGRFSVTLVEPSYRNSLWLWPVGLRWVVRGAPTNQQQIGMRPVVDPMTFARLRSTGVPILSEAERQNAADRIQDRFGAEFASLAPQRLPGRQTQLADGEVDPAIQFVLLNMAADRYSESGNINGAVAALKVASQKYQVDGPTRQAQLLRVAFQSQPSAEQCSDIARFSLDFSEEAAELYRYVEAWEMAELAQRAAKQAKVPHYEQLARDAMLQLAPLKEAWLQVAESFRQWQEHPDDSSLNARVGRFLAFVAEEWELGLECLAAGDDQDLKDLSRLAAKDAATALEKVRTADRWMEYAAGLPLEQRQAVERKTRHWYQEALDDLTGSDAARVKRILSKSAGAPASLRIRLTLDEIGLLNVRSDEISWVTQSGREPATIWLNEQEWDPRVRPKLPNRGSTRFLPKRVVVERVTVQDQRGRAFVSIQDRDAQHAVIRISDVPAGASEVAFTLQVHAE